MRREGSGSEAASSIDWHECRETTTYGGGRKEGDEEKAEHEQVNWKMRRGKGGEEGKKDTMIVD